MTQEYKFTVPTGAYLLDKSLGANKHGIYVGDALIMVYDPAFITTTMPVTSPPPPLPDVPPDPTPTPTPPPVQLYTNYVIKTGVLNVRQEPSVKAVRLGSLHSGTKFRAYAGIVEGADKDSKVWQWVKINDVFIDGKYELTFHGAYVALAHTDGTNVLVVEDKDLAAG